MSEALKLSSKDVREWLERETSSIFIPVHEKAQKLLNEMKKALENIEDVSKMLLEKSRKEIEKRNMKTYGRARALNKLARLFIERTQQIEIPEKVSYDSFHEFIQETERAFLVTEVDVRNWFPRISPFFILDRRKFSAVFERAKESLKELQSFLRKDYVKTKTLEKTFQLIDKLLTLEGQLEDLEAKKKKMETEKVLIENKMAEIQQKIADLKNRENLTKLNQIDTEIEKLNMEVKHSLRHLQKPFIKFRSLAFHKGGLTPEELKKLNQYIENPFDAFASEKTGYPLLKQILQKLNRLISEEKLKLKRDKKRKAEKAIENILNKNSLDVLYQKTRNAIMLKKQLSTSTETMNIKKNILRLQEKLKELEKRKKLRKSKMDTIEKTFEETLERIRDQKKEIEANVFDFLDRKILIK